MATSPWSLPEAWPGSAEDHPLAQGYLEALAELVTGHLDLEVLWQALPEVSLAPVAEISAPPVPHVRLGVARDQAFCFYYPENLEWLRHFGAEIVEFSPLTDPRLLTSLRECVGSP